MLDEMESNLMQATVAPSGALWIAAQMTFVTSGLGALLASYRALHTRIDFTVSQYRAPDMTVPLRATV